MSFHRAAPAGAALCLFLLAGLAGCATEEEPTFRGQVVETPEPAPPLEGVDWTGEPFRLESEEGKVAVVFFGYTYCPDVCPFALAKMKQLRARLGEEADDLSVVFVSVDPDRDTVAKLADYVPNFHPSFHGVRLDMDQLKQVQEDWDLTVQYGQPKNGPGTDSFYYVDHTGNYYLLDRQGRLRVTHPPNATVDQMLPDVETLLAS